MKREEKYNKQESVMDNKNNIILTRRKMKETRRDEEAKMCTKFM